VVSIALICISWLLWLDHRLITEEKHVLENLQLLFLLSAFGFHLHQRFRVPTSALRICHLILAMFCFSVFLREFDIDKIGDAEIWSYAEIIIRTIAVIAFLSTIYIAILNIRALWAIRRDVLLSINSLLTAMAVVLYIASWPFDKGYISVSPDISRFIEESIQLTGVLFFLAGSLKPLRKI
jgi:hypothetical protein